jgi:hypothetical protein
MAAFLRGNWSETVRDIALGSELANRHARRSAASSDEKREF